VPYPIQLGAITDRLRKFFRIRGRTNFALDEIVAPVVLVQDLTVGPYQAGVTPCAGSIVWNLPVDAGGLQAYVLLLNDKAGSVTPVLGKQFDGRSFSVTWMDIQNATAGGNAEELSFQLQLIPRANVVAAGVPINAENLVSIQDNDGTITVPVEAFTFDPPGVATGATIWRGILGDNTNTLGSRRTLEPNPTITIGPKDAILFRQIDVIAVTTQALRVNVRGFYQEQPS